MNIYFGSELFPHKSFNYSLLVIGNSLLIREGCFSDSVGG